MKVNAYEETLPNGKKYIAVYNANGTLMNSKIYRSIKSLFLMGDNRDCSKDSRFLSSVGYVNKLNLVSKAQTIFSNDTVISSVLKFWNWSKSFRYERLLKSAE